MGVNGWINAKCKVCGKIETWYLRDIPFADSEIVGTCHKCDRTEVNKNEGEVIKNDV